MQAEISVFEIANSLNNDLTNDHGDTRSKTVDFVKNGGLDILNKHIRSSGFTITSRCIDNTIVAVFAYSLPEVSMVR